MMFLVTKECRAAGMSNLQRERQKKRHRITNKQEPRLYKVRKMNERIDSEDSDDEIKSTQTMRRKRNRVLVVSDSESENDISNNKRNTRNKNQNTEYCRGKYNTSGSEKSENSIPVNHDMNISSSSESSSSESESEAESEESEAESEESKAESEESEAESEAESEESETESEESEAESEEQEQGEEEQEEQEEVEEEGETPLQTDSEFNDDEDENEKELKGEMSIYRLNVEKVNGLSSIKSEEQLLKKLVKAVTKTGCVTHKPMIKNKCKPFLMTYFYYKTESAKNYTAFSINRDRKLKDRRALMPGSRKPGNILTYYRLKMENIALPEVYFLCNCDGYHAILHLCDTTFRAKIAKQFIDGNRIKEIETINIAGPDVTTKITYKSNFNIECHSESFLEKVVNSLAGYIKTDTDLYKVIQSKNGQDVLMKIGLNFVRVCKQMTYGTYAKILELFSRQTPFDRCENHAYFLEALDYVQRVSNRAETGELNERFEREIVNMIADKSLSDKYYLSHRFARDWEIASEVTLNEQFFDRSVKDDPEACEQMYEIESWNSAPTLQMVTQALYRRFPNSNELKKVLRLQRIKLEFFSQNWLKQKHNLQDFVHGYIDDKNEKYYKIAQKWFFLSGKFSQIIDKNFQRFLKLHPLMEFNFNNQYKGSEILMFPWCLSNEIAHFELTDMTTVLAIDEESAERITDILCCSLTAVDKNGFQLTRSSCLLSYLSPFHEKLSRELLKTRSGKRKRKTLPTPDDNESNTVSSILFQLYNKDEIPGNLKSILTEKIICCERVDGQEETFNIINPVLTKKMWSMIKKLELNLSERKLLNFLISRCPLREEEYSDLYLQGEQFSKLGLTYVPGDRILCNNTKLFDVLAFDGKNSQTYLFHIKKDLDYQTREACSQIRNAAELLWNDFIRGQDNNVQLFWEKASTSSTSTNPSLIFLKEEMDKLAKDKYMRMFSEDMKIIFVFAFMTLRGKTKKEMIVRKVMTKKDCKDNDFPVRVFRYLKKKDILEDNGCISEHFIRMTSKEFQNLAMHIPNVNEEKARQLYSFLLEYEYNLSTNTKLELLTLDSHFSRYQIGGKRHFDLRIMQLPSK
ncbi:uncharacterized protein [Mytilus edulis]|uniref:uncharacterized protein n=1 Tax=Mytilus edulis TaxID=6550 RepID=UPI0039EF04D3